MKLWYYHWMNTNINISMKESLNKWYYRKEELFTRMNFVQHFLSSFNLSLCFHVSLNVVKLFVLLIPFLFYRFIIYTCRCYSTWREWNIVNWILGLRQTTFVALFYHQVYENIIIWSMIEWMKGSFTGWMI